jgi:branched-chain amino acid transport system substrate-binding protein
MERKRLITRTGSIFLVLILVALSFVVACGGEAPPSEQKTLRIGMILGLTGFFSVREVPDMNQSKFAADMINEQGGITVKGEKYLVELVPEDTKSTMDGVTSAANKLVFDEGIKFIIGPTAFFAAAAGPVCDPNKALRVLTWSSNTPGELDASTPYAFLATNASVASSAALVKFLKNKYPDVEKVAIVAPDAGISNLIGIAKNLLEAEGISVVGDVTLYPNEMQDFSPIVTKLNAIKEADAIFMQNGLGPHIGSIVKGLRELGNNKPYVASLLTSINEITAIAGKEATRDVATTLLMVDDPAIPPMAKEIIDRTVAEYGADYPLQFTGANSVWVLAQVIEEAQSLDPTVVKEKWESMSEVETIFGTGIICGDETFGIKHHVVAHPQAIQFLKNDVVASEWIEVYIP